MAVRWLLVLASAAVGGIVMAQPVPELQPPPVIPETLAPGPSSVTPFVVPAQPAKSSPPLPVAPPAPAITMLLLVPADVPPGQPIPYVIRVTNNSNADAGKVTVRMPLPEGATLLSADPRPAADKELVWEIKTLARGETKSINVSLKVEKGDDVTAKAYVSYEFGQAVKTRLSPAKVQVRTELPREATTGDEMIPVRVSVSNNGRVPLTNVKLTETISNGFEFHSDTDGEPDKQNAQIRTWNLGTIPAGTGKSIDFRVMGKAAGELMARSNVDTSDGVQHSHEARVKVQNAKLKVELRGDPQASDDTASFKVVVKNEGSTTLTNVRVVGSVPQDCRVSSRTNGGQIYQGQVVWGIARIAPGDSYLFKWDLRSSSAGRKTIRAEAVSDRGLRDSMDVDTVFSGTAALNWETRFEQATVGLDRNGMFTVKLTNSGNETSKAAKITVILPDGVSFVQATPAHKVDGLKVTFDARDVRAGGNEVFSITFRGDKPGSAFFHAKLESDGAKPLSAEKYVQITR